FLVTSFAEVFRSSMDGPRNRDHGAANESLFRALFRRSAMIARTGRERAFDGDLETFLERTTGMTQADNNPRPLPRRLPRTGSQITAPVRASPGGCGGFPPSPTTSPPSRGGWRR